VVKRLTSASIAHWRAPFGCANFPVDYRFLLGARHEFVSTDTNTDRGKCRRYRLTIQGAGVKATTRSQMAQPTAKAAGCAAPRLLVISSIDFAALPSTSESDTNVRQSERAQIQSVSLVTCRRVVRKHNPKPIINWYGTGQTRTMPRPTIDSFGKVWLEAKSIPAQLIPPRRTPIRTIPNDVVTVLTIACG